MLGGTQERTPDPEASSLSIRKCTDKPAAVLSADALALHFDLRPRVVKRDKGIIV